MTIYDRHVWYGKAKNGTIFARRWLSLPSNQTKVIRFDFFYRLRMHRFSNAIHYTAMKNVRATAIYFRLIVRSCSHTSSTRHIHSVYLAWWHTTNDINTIYFYVIFIKWPFSKRKKNAEHFVHQEVQVFGVAFRGIKMTNNCANASSIKEIECHFWCFAITSNVFENVHLGCFFRSEKKKHNKEWAKS